MNLTGAEFIYTVTRRVFPNEEFFLGVTLFYNHVVSDMEYNFLKSATEVPMALLVKVLLISFEIFPYPIPSFSDIKGWTSYGKRKEPYLWAWNAAIKMGLIDCNTDPDTPATKPQFRSILQKLEMGDHAKLSKVAKGSFAGADLLPGETTRETWEWRNGIIEGLKKIPQQYLELFRDSGWVITYSPFTVAKGYSQYSSGKYAGLCNHSKKRIHIVDPSPSIIIHEFGHFIVRMLGVTDEQEQLFREEGNAVVPLLRKYARTNPAEYFAVFWETWFTTSYMKRALLRTSAPKTVAFIEAICSC